MTQETPLTDSEQFRTPDDDDAYTDLDADEAFQVGVLAELSAIRAELQGIRQALEHQADVQTEAAAGDEPEYRCRSCDDVVTGKDAAREHAVECSGAPPGGTAWKASMGELR